MPNPPNIKQKLVLLDIDANTQSTIQEKLDLGFYIHHVINLQPKYEKLLIIYYDPSIET